jgi:hypothetical protein
VRRSVGTLGTSGTLGFGELRRSLAEARPREH